MRNQRIRHLNILCQHRTDLNKGKMAGTGNLKQYRGKERRILVVVWRRLLACKLMINLFAYVNN